MIFIQTFHPLLPIVQFSSHLEQLRMDHMEHS